MAVFVMFFGIATVSSRRLITSAVITQAQRRMPKGLAIRELGALHSSALTRFHR